MLIGNDVVSLLASLSARSTAKAVKSQILKSKITWNNVHYDWLRLYHHLNRELIEDIDIIKQLLPWKKKGRCGKGSGRHSKECIKRHLVRYFGDCFWDWPNIKLTATNKIALLSTAIEEAIKFSLAILLTHLVAKITYNLMVDLLGHDL